MYPETRRYLSSFCLGTFVFSPLLSQSPSHTHTKTGMKIRKEEERKKERKKIKGIVEKGTYSFISGAPASGGMSSEFYSLVGKSAYLVRIFIKTISDFLDSGIVAFKDHLSTTTYERVFKWHRIVVGLMTQISRSGSCGIVVGYSVGCCCCCCCCCRNVIIQSSRL